MKGSNYFFVVVFFFIVFSCKENDSENEFVAPPIAVTQSPYDNPTWHPSGKIIGFNHTPIKEISYYNGQQYFWKFNRNSTGFWLIDNDGTNMRRILPYRLYTPAWSPDGKWIAFSRNAQICIMPFDGEKFDTTATHTLTDNGRNFFPSWSPDGKWLTYDSNEDSDKGQYFIWKINTTGTIKKRIAYTPHIGEIRMPYWRQDNSILHQRYVAEKKTPDIFSMDSTGSNVIRITDNDIFEVNIKSSAKNEYITYVSYSGKLTLNRLDVSTNETVTLTEWCEDYSWSPDGERIVYVNFNDTYIDKTMGCLWIMDKDGKNKEPLTYNNFKIMK